MWLFEGPTACAPNPSLPRQEGQGQGGCCQGRSQNLESDAQAAKHRPHLIPGGKEGGKGMIEWGFRVACDAV